MTGTLNILLKKLDGFIRRYYLNQLIRGIILFGAGLFLLLILFTSFEHFGYFGSGVRFVLFYTFLLYNLIVLILYVIRPFLGMLRLGRRISPEYAAKILGKYFPDKVNDKITNVLQLKRFLDDNPGDTSLIMAGIDQKARETSTVPFQNAIPLKGNLKYMPYIVFPVVIILAVIMISPAIITEPAKRIVMYEQAFERPRPFDIYLESETRGFRNEDVEVEVTARGDVLPSDAFVLLGESRYKMEQPSGGSFVHTLRNVQDDLSFYIEAGGFRFGPYFVEIFEKASIESFAIKIDYPGYTGLESEEFNNMGDIEVLKGSQIIWTVFTNPGSELEFRLDDNYKEVESMQGGQHRIEFTATDSFNYSIYAIDKEHGPGDSLSYSVNTRADNFPSIAVEEHRDDLLTAHLFYRGTISDDFGFSSLEFNYRVMDSGQVNRGEDVPFMNEGLDIDKTSRNQTFYHHFDLGTVYVQPGETVELYFEVADNDMVSGPKTTRSRIFSYYIPTEQEILAERRESEEMVEQGLSDGVGEVREARDQIDDLRKNLLDSERIGWEEREALQELLEKREQAEERMREISEQKKEAETRSEQFMESNERIKEKQEELQKLFDEVLTDEMKELFDMIREELENLDRDQIYEMLDKMDFELGDMEMRMDRALDMFRQFAMERLLEESIERLEKLGEQQMELAEGADGTENGESTADEQQNIEDAYENIREMMDEFRETNEKLSRPKSIEDTSAEEEEISEILKEIMENLEMNDMDNSVRMQMDAGQMMEQLSGGLRQMQMEMFQEQIAEDARAVRMVLENLLRSSFAQEDLMTDTRLANVNDPLFLELMRDQRKIQRDMEVIGDSLMAIGKRQIAIQSYVNRELNEINHQMRLGIDHMVNRRRYQAASRQQLVMTHINNLALLLNESLQQMQMQMAMSMGMGDESDMNDGMQSFQDLRQMQQQLNEMLEQMREGHQPEPGQTGDTPMSVSEQMARMAAEQEAIRSKLKELADDMRNQGMEVNGELEQIQRDMERSELDMLRKEISSQTINRQERILTRLLEHERAEMQRESEERREGTTAENYEISNPEDVFEYNRIREREVEMLRSMPPGLRPFYRSLVEKYFINVE